MLLSEQNLHFSAGRGRPRLHHREGPDPLRRLDGRTGGRRFPPRTVSFGLIMSAQRSLTVGIDVGGTFTDLLAVDPRTKRGQARQGADHHRQPGDRLHGGPRRRPAPIPPPCRPWCMARRPRPPTRCSNARSPRSGSITTKGFRDVLELGRRTRPQPYGLRGTFRPLIEREYRLEVAGAHGRRRQGADAARRGGRGRGAQQAAGAGLRGRRHPFPAQLHQSRARAPRRRDRARRCGPTPTSRRATPSCRSIASTSAA